MRGQLLRALEPLDQLGSDGNQSPCLDLARIRVQLCRGGIGQ